MKSSVNLGRLGLTKLNFETLSFLVKNARDYNYFLTVYWSGENNQFFSINEYRKYKIQIQAITYKVFITEFTLNPITALERLFQHRITKADYSLLSDKIKRKETTIDYIFEQHKKQPEVRFIRLVI